MPEGCCADTTEMTLHVSAASIHGLVAVCAVARGSVTYNYCSLRGDSVTASAAVMLLLQTQEVWHKTQTPNTLRQLSDEDKHFLFFVCVGLVKLCGKWEEGIERAWIRIWVNHQRDNTKTTGLNPLLCAP